MIATPAAWIFTQQTLLRLSGFGLLGDGKVDWSDG